MELWSAETGKKLPPLIGHKHNVIAVGFAPDGKTLASASVDGVKLWDLRTGVVSATFDCEGDLVAFSPDSKLLVSPSFERAKLWDLEMGLESLIYEKKSSE